MYDIITMLYIAFPLVKMNGVYSVAYIMCLLCTVLRYYDVTQSNIKQ